MEEITVITHVGTVCIFVEDQDRAKAFYTDKLGFELVADQPLFPGASNRWVSVKPAGAATEIILYKVDENWQHYTQVVGQSQAVTFNVTDMAKLTTDLKAKGVNVTDPDVQPWGTNAFLTDSEGNRLLLVQQPT